MRRVLTAVCAATITAAGIAAMPAIALASGGSNQLWVSQSAPADGSTGTSCSDPGFNTISAALGGVPFGGTIHVCAGVYTEQLQITVPVTITGIGKVVVRLPKSPVNSSTACDNASDAVAGHQADQDGVSICGNIPVSLNGLRIVSAWPAGTCSDSLYGVLIGGGATVQVTNTHVTAAGAVPLNGCQGGIGIQDGMGWAPNQTGALVVSHSTVSGYQKNGITVGGAGSTAQISNVTVKGIGATDEIAQNGIEVDPGAVVNISRSTITGNECDVVPACGPNNLKQSQSAGVLFYGAAAGSSVSDSTISGNDIGVYYLADPAGKAPKSAQVRITGDTIRLNRYEGVVLDQGRASVTDCTITSSAVGIQVLQYKGQTFGSRSAASHDTIRLMSWASVQVLSDRAKTGDIAGSFRVSYSLISTAPVRDNSRNLPIIRSHDR